MIEEIFITQKDVVLLGNPKEYPARPSYPTHVVGDRQLTQYKRNDVNISALYTNLDVFYVLEYLEDLCREIENHTSALTAKTISDYYFKILEIKNNFQYGPKTKENTVFDLIQSNDVYVDVIETFNVVIRNEKVQQRNIIMDSPDVQITNSQSIDSVLKNEIVGYIFVKPNFIDSKTFKLILNKNNFDFISEKKVTKKFNKIEVEMDIANETMEVFRYLTKSRNPPPVDLHKENGIYKLKTRDDVIFDHLEIKIPVPQNIKKLKIKNSKGTVLHDEMISVVKWTFKNEKVVRADLSLEIEAFVEEECSNELNVKFCISKSNNNHMKIEKAVCLGNPSVKVWIKYDLCNGTYKIRV
ncbi:clathrin coat assembly protein [Nosema bombycis CQ1]|uniref:Clathrin coat assembly protein n=1 Tax=Nosema bombycis (strain CQ1 / CVCC 102059) TaxID=578461 RepID=R0KX22_NOSB1|nr:clathrin coat assembly protein [Nosema bombycis CQ1]|eukprot:EOB15421.1 clathrin coat assembly protein [Nosema bombycis CQ1]